MAQSVDEIAKDMVVAWLSRSALPEGFTNSTEAGEAIGKLYTAVLQAVKQGTTPAA